MFKKRKLGSNYWDAIHENVDAEKRAASLSCPNSLSLCASSFGGGCCPTDYSCGLSSCYPTAAAIMTTSGCQAGFTTCNIAAGGCCQSGYTCQRNTCIPPTGTSSVCAADSFLCPSSVGYGCCRSDLSCGIRTCYETTSTTLVPLTLTLTTTNSKSALTTITTVVETTYNPMITSDSPSPPITPITKLSAITTFPTASSTSSAPGINVKELGGIIGACVFLLIVLLLATYLILRRLNLTIRLTGAGRGTTHPRGPNSRSSNRRVHSIGIDPLQQIPSSRTGTRSYRPMTNPTTPSELSDNTRVNRPGTRHFNAHGSRSQPLVSLSTLNWPSSSVSRSTNANGSSGATGAYQSLPSSDGSRHWRNDSDGSQSQPVSNLTTTATMNSLTAELQSPDPQQGYFDIPIVKTASAMITANIDPAIRDQNLRYGHTANGSQGSEQRPSISQTRNGHGRQYSDVSELSNGTENTNESYELEGTSPQTTYSSKFGAQSNGLGYNPLYGSENQNDKKGLREGVMSRVQSWVGMTSLGRRTSIRRDDGLGLGRLKMIPSSTLNHSFNPQPLKNQDQEHWLRGMDLPPFKSRFMGGGGLEAITEASRESSTTVGTFIKSDGHGEVSDSRARIARMEFKRLDSDLTPIDADKEFMA